MDIGGRQLSLHKLTRGRRVRYEVRWREGTRQRSRNFDRRSDALAFGADVRRRAQLGAHAPVDPPRIPLGDWLRTWWLRDGVRWQPSTRRVRADLIDRWLLPLPRRHDCADARLLTVDAYGHTELLNPSACASAAITAYLVDGTLPAVGTVCSQDKAPFAPGP